MHEKRAGGCELRSAVPAIQGGGQADQKTAGHCIRNVLLFYEFAQCRSPAIRLISIGVGGDGTEFLGGSCGDNGFQARFLFSCWGKFDTPV